LVSINQVNGCNLVLFLFLALHLSVFIGVVGSTEYIASNGRMVNVQ
jgi:hypothetical protein